MSFSPSKIFFCIFLSLVGAAGAQDLQGLYQVRQYGTEDGLPSNGIKGLQWDKETGFLWIATEAGIVRFNGVGFKTFTPADDPNISNDRSLFLVKNNAGRIYTADQSGHIFHVVKNHLVFDRKEFITGNNSSNSFTLTVSDRLHDANHKVSLASLSLQFDNFLPVSDTSLYIIKLSRLYFLSASMKDPVEIPLPERNIRTAFKCGGGYYFIHRNNQVTALDPVSGLFSPVSFELENNQVVPDFSKSRIIWENGMEYPIFFSQDRAYMVVREGSVLKARLVATGIPGDVLIRYAQYDPEKEILFIGTDSKGIVVLRRNKLRVLKKERTSPEERTSYYAQVELENGAVLTNEGHVLGMMPGQPQIKPFIARFQNNTYLMGDSLFWFTATSPGKGVSCLHRYHLKKKQLTAYEKIKQPYAQLVMTASRGTLYLANEAGIFKMAGDSTQQVYRYPLTDRQNIHFDMRETAPGVLVLSNCNTLLQFRVDENKLDTLFNAGNYCVRTSWSYGDYLFFGTYGGGLYISRNGVVRALPVDKNKYLLFTHCFISDGNGYCWISTNRGLFKASIREMINAYESGAQQIYYHYFGKNDGMDMTEMNGGCTPCGLVLKNGNISFPTMEGLLWVNPQRADPFLPAGEIFVDDLLVDNQRSDPALLESRPLSSSGHDLLLRLGFSAWCNKENIYLQYELNRSGNWKNINTDNDAVIALSNLKSGDYLLRVRKLNGYGINNYSYTEIRFSVLAPWYQQWWFLVLSVAFIWGLIILYFRFRTRQLKQRQRKLEALVENKTFELQEKNEVLEKNNSIKTRLISIISHDIVTPLKFLTAAGKSLQDNKTLMPEELQQETIREMTNTSQELQLLSTNILNWIKYQNENRRMVKESFPLHEMVAQVLGILQSLARQKQLTVLNQVDPGIVVNQYYEPLKILVYNLLTNAIQFTEKGRITIDAEWNNGNLSVSVTDEGIGMTPEQIQRLMGEEVVITSANVDNKRGHGLGYLIIKDLVKTMGATIHIGSRPGKGTTVTVSMPAGSNGNH